jgi:hypothetical protein
MVDRRRGRRQRAVSGQPRAELVHDLEHQDIQPGFQFDS